MKLNKMQGEAISSNTPITIVAVGAGAGSTTALLFKMITDGGFENVFLYPTYIQADRAVQAMLQDFKEYGIETTYSRIHNRFTIHFKLQFDCGWRVVRFRHSTQDGASQGLSGNVYVDHINNLPLHVSDHLLDQVNRNGINKLTVTAYPRDCGWREFEYDRGRPTRKMSKASWDFRLVNWRNDCRHTLARVDQYKGLVQVVTNYGVEENPTLMKTEYLRCLQNMEPEYQEDLSGTWIDTWPDVE